MKKSRRVFYAPEGSAYWDWVYKRLRWHGQHAELPEANPDMLPESKGLTELANQSVEDQHSIEIRTEKLKHDLIHMARDGLLRPLSSRELEVHIMLTVYNWTERQMAKRLHVTNQVIHTYSMRAKNKIKKFVKSWMAKAQFRGYSED